MPKLEQQIFICTNQRDPSAARGSCDPTGERLLHKAFKDRLKELGFKGKIAATRTGCLDQCEHGPTVLIYPGQHWYGRVRMSDVEEIIQSHVVEGKPVERLLLPEGCVNAECEHKKR